MESTAGRAIAIVGVGAVLPDAPDAGAFWRNVREGRYSISDVPKDRWDSDLYYDPDPKAPDKSYTKIGGWVRDFEWEPLKWRLPIPPKVSDAMDLTQKWAILVVRQALADYGYPDRPLNPERTAVIFGNAMGGDTHLYSSARILFPEFAQELGSAPSFGSLPADVRAAVLEEMQQGIGRRLPPITEDTMPGELSNIVAGRIAALYDFRGPNFTTDAACASAVAAVKAAMEGLIQGDYDAVLTGGIDANMSPASYVKFCKIGALSATGSRPYAEGADGFVMGEGAVTFLMKRLADAERDGDRIYAVIRGIGASSDGRGKGITAPNPAGQKLAVRRAWQNAGLAPQPGDLVEGHGTSTAVGDVVEVQSMIEVFQDLGLPPGSVSLGSVKSNIGHLKGAAGAVGMLKAALALHEKVLPPSINYERPNPGLDWAASPFVVNTALRPWEASGDGVRRVGASAFGFGGTNFHTVLEEYVPGRLKADDRTLVQGAAIAGAGGGGSAGMAAGGNGAADMDVRAPLRGALVIGGDSDDVVRAKLERVLDEARAGRAPEPAPPREADLRAPVRLAIDFGDAEELAGKAEKALAALERDQSNRWRALRSKGVFLGRGPAAKVAFLFSGQGSQYVNMLRDLRDAEPVVADTFAEADAVMEPLLGRPLTDHIYVDGENEAAVAEAEEALKQTAITQPAVLTTETALARLLGAYGVVPDMTMGHSLGEYGALVAAGALTFPDALKAVSARGKEMTRIAFDDNGTMAAVFGPMDQVQGILDGVDGYVVVANINSTKECVIGGATTAVEAATAALQEAGYRVTRLPVSHAFHTQIVAPASGALAEVLDRLGLEPPTVPTIANISGDFYPSGPGARAEMVDILSLQVGSPVQFVNGLKRLYDAGARVFVELGPKRALTGFVTDVLGGYDDVVPLFTNHPRLDDDTGVNIALCGLYAAGLGTGVADAVPVAESAP
ncbi:MAG: type I polyketide synthase, partial [Gemmatimonadota bacterium]